MLDLERCMHVVQLYRCQKERAVLGVSEPELRQRYLCLTPDRLLVLAAHPSRLGAGLVKSNRALGALAKVSCNKKRAPSRLVLWYRREGGGAGDGGCAGDGGGDATATAAAGAASPGPGPGSPAALLLDQRVYHVDAADEFKAALTAMMARLADASP
jgi:hypothetical protein